jgi:hypothetical protein
METRKMPQPKKPVSIKDAAISLLLMHAELFGEKSLSGMTELCKITFKTESEFSRALWEWLYFGLYVFVEGTQNNFPQSDDVGIGVRVARVFLQEFEGHLLQAGLEHTALTVKQREIDDRIKRYEAVATSDRPEQVGFAVAGSVLGLNISSGKVPASIEAYEFSILANQAYIAALKVVNDFFQGCTMVP